jgi:glutathione-regulated potassium-efflux system ancillary protein KefG
MKRILVLFAHPALQQSRANRSLLKAIDGMPGVTLHDLYQLYPDQMIDAAREQAQLAAHDIIVFQHPFYWFSAPALLKEWCDMVLQYGYAYGEEATALQGKQWLSAITTGGTAQSYTPEGYNRHPTIDYLLPYRQTASLCGMTWLPPFVMHSFDASHDNIDVDQVGREYRRLLEALRDDRLPTQRLTEVTYLRELLEEC